MVGGLLVLAESDLKTSLESDFGRQVSITFQSGVKNVYGQVISQFEKGEFQIDCKGLAQGNYYVFIQSKDKGEVVRMITVY